MTSNSIVISHDINFYMYIYILIYPKQFHKHVTACHAVHTLYIFNMFKGDNFTEIYYFLQFCLLWNDE